MSQDALGLLKHLKTARARWPFPDGAFICQSQSQNAHLQTLSMLLSQLTSMYFYKWKMGLKMGMYDLCMRPGVQAIQFRGLLVTLPYL